MNIRDWRKKIHGMEDKKKWYLAGLLVLIAVILAGSIYTVSYFYRLNRQETQYESLKEAARTDLSGVGETEQTHEIRGEVVYDGEIYDFEELRRTNADIYAWITIPGTQVDYPILQSETDNYYLEYNLDHSKGYPGCIYSNQCNSRDFLDYLTVLYGHNMKNGSMFGCLHEFEQEEFFEATREILVYTEDKRLTYEITAAVRFSDVYIPARYGVTTTEGRDDFVEDVKNYAADSEISHLWEKADTTGDDARYLVLSTCVNGADEQRYLLVGRLTEQTAYQ